MDPVNVRRSLPQSQRSGLLGIGVIFNGIYFLPINIYIYMCVYSFKAVVKVIIKFVCGISFFAEICIFPVGETEWQSSF